MQENVLIADDDAGWLNELRPHTYFPDCSIVDNVAAAIAKMECGENFDAAIFDRYLMAGELPFDKGRLHSEAGFALAVLFQRRFPGKRMVICTGAGPDDRIPENISEIVHRDLCIYVCKNDSGSAERVHRFLRGEPDKVRWSQKLWEYLEAQPSFCGLGVNLKTVIKDIGEWMARVRRQKSSAAKQLEPPPGRDTRSVPAQRSLTWNVELPDPAERAGIIIIDDRFAEATLLAEFISGCLQGKERPLVAGPFPHETEILNRCLDGRLASCYEVRAVESLWSLRRVVSRLKPEIVVARTSSDTLSSLDDLQRTVAVANPQAAFILISDEAAILKYSQIPIRNVVGVIETPMHFQYVVRQMVLRIISRTVREPPSCGLGGADRTTMLSPIPEDAHAVYCFTDTCYEADLAARCLNDAFAGGAICGEPIVADGAAELLDGRLSGRIWATPLFSYGGFRAALGLHPPSILVIEDLSEIQYVCIMEALEKASSLKIIIVGDEVRIREMLAHKNCHIPPSSVFGVVQGRLPDRDVVRCVLDCICELGI